MNQEIQKADLNESQIALKGQNQLIGDWIRTKEEYSIAQTYSEKKLGQFDKSDMTILVELMAQWKVHIGITAETFDNELVFICQFLYDNFKHFTISDIRLAMNWAISGKLDLSYVSSKTLSSLYVSKALNLYEDEKRRIVNIISQQKDSYNRQKELNSKLEISPLDKANQFKEHIVSVYQKYKEDSLLIDIGDLIYNWIRANKIINISNSDVEEAIKYAHNRYIDEVSNKSIRTPFKTSIDEVSKELRKKKFAREYILMKFFDKVDIINIIKVIREEQFK
jgi:hypothetical protein